MQPKLANCSKNHVVPAGAASSSKQALRMDRIMHEGLLSHGLKCCTMWQSDIWEGVVRVGLGGHNKCTQTRLEMADFLFLKGKWVVLRGPLHFCVLISRSLCSTVHNLDRFIALGSNQNIIDILETILSLYKQITQCENYLSSCCIL